MHEELIARLEAATGPDDALDLALAEYAWDNRIPMPPPYYDGGPINYDPRLWLERHDWRPTASIDAALTLFPSGKGHDPWWMLKAAWRGKAKAEVWVDGKGKPFRGEAATPALAICIASLRAQANREWEG